jgi:hypothetical protein
MIRLLVALLLLLAPIGARAAAIASAFYEGRAYVTGTRAETRGDALLTALRRVLVKVSGNPAWAEDERVTALAPLLGAMTLDIAYLDRMTDTPHHDEQGTRDRPYDLIAHFDPVRVDAALILLGDAPWTAPRPRVSVRVVIHDHEQSFKLTADAETDERHRQALLAAAERFGMQVAVGLDGQAAPAAPVVLDGVLTWSDQAFGWVADWRSAGVVGEARWGVSGVSFDEAYRAGLGGVAARLSGH